MIGQSILENFPDGGKGIIFYPLAGVDNQTVRINQWHHFRCRFPHDMRGNDQKHYLIPSDGLLK
jgi:hypothetical protein